MLYIIHQKSNITYQIEPTITTIKIMIIIIWKNLINDVKNHNRAKSHKLNLKIHVIYMGLMKLEC